MFAKLAATSVAAFTALAILAVATPTPMPNAADSGSCSTGALQCCNSVQDSNDLSVSALLSLLGVVLGDLNVPIGLGCDPISVVGVGSGNACSANAVCCENNNVGGLLSIGCLPAIL